MLENCVQNQRQTAVKGLSHCRERVKAVRAGHLRIFPPPSCSNPAKGCAFSSMRREGSRRELLKNLQQKKETDDLSWTKDKQKAMQYNLRYPPTTSPAHPDLSTSTNILVRKQSQELGVAQQTQCKARFPSPAAVQETSIQASCHPTVRNAAAYRTLLPHIAAQRPISRAVALKLRSASHHARTQAVGGGKDWSSRHLKLEESALASSVVSQSMRVTGVVSDAGTGVGVRRGCAWVSLGQKIETRG